MALIFIVEDNESIREAAASYLKLQEHEVLEFGKISGVFDAVIMKNPDLIILDVMLPDGDGFRLAKQIRARSVRSQIPILFLTAKTSESDRITGFEVGGDDYVTKPFSPKELVLRVSAILRRTRKDKGLEIVEWRLGKDKLQVDESAHRILVNNKEASLTAAEWKILVYLLENSGIVVSRDRILGECLDYMAEGSERTVDTHVKNIRKKLGNPDWIETVREYGYRFAGQQT